MQNLICIKEAFPKNLSRFLKCWNQIRNDPIESNAKYYSWGHNTQPWYNETKPHSSDKLF